MNSSQQLTAALADLPEPARSVYVLSARDALSYEQIAEQLGISVTAVEPALAEALAAIDRRIGTIAAAGAVAPGRRSG